MSADFLWVLAIPNWQGCNDVWKEQRLLWNRSGRHGMCDADWSGVGGWKCKTCSWNQISGRRKCLRCVCLINAVKLQQYKHCILLNEGQRAQRRWPKHIYLHAVQLRYSTLLKNKYIFYLRIYYSLLRSRVGSPSNNTVRLDGSKSNWFPRLLCNKQQ